MSIIAAILGVALASWMGPPAIQTPPPGAPPGVLVDVGGHKLHIRCIGPSFDGPTVILEAGGGGYSTSWSAVQDLLPRVRSCAYDRAGSGWSEPGPAPRTMRQEVFELRALLKASRIRGPLVLVGQSIGGMLARLYAEQHGRDVAGVVLVDPTHESSVLGNARLGGWVRLREHATGRPVPKPRRNGKPAGTEYKPEDDYLAEEFQLLYLARQAKPVPLGDRPLIVLGAGKRPAPPGTPDDQWQALKREKDEQVRDQAGLSRNSRFVLAAESGHNIQRDNPQLVARSIEEVVGAVTKRARLSR